MTSVEQAAMDWKNLVKVNGSFYCNLSLGQASDADAGPAKWPGADISSVAHLDKPIYVNHFNGAIQSPAGGPSNRTILRIGDDDHYEASSLGYEVTNEASGAGPAEPCHTIKLVIGEPLSLDTSEYVSWDGSQTGAQSGASTDDNAPDYYRQHRYEDDDDDIEDDEDEASNGETRCSPPRYAPPPPPPPVMDELTDSCCQFFDQRQQRLFKSATLNQVEPATNVPASGLQDKMEHLRREIVSLVNQDDALFRQLLALNTTIHQLRNQSMRGSDAYSSGRLRSHLSPTPSANSLTSLTSMSDAEDDGPEDEVGEHLNVESRLDHETPCSTVLSSAVTQALTRKRVSYPPRARNRSGSQLSRYSFNSSSSTSSAASSVSSSAAGSPTWSSSDAKPKPARTPRSPHSSFYSRATSSKQHHSRLAINQKLQQRPLSRGSTVTSDLLMVLHKRQGSYDSGCQVSEPSDAEVFV